MASRSMIALRERGEHATTSMFETGSVIPLGVESWRMAGVRRELCGRLRSDDFRGGF